MNVKAPDPIKAEIPPTMFGRIMSSTPVVMTVIATMLAGLASSEMTKAQYDRSLAAQQQSKAGDQWSFFQAKRLRSALQHNTLDLLQAANEIHPLNAGAVKQAVAASSAGADKIIARLDSAEGRNALSLLQKGALPANVSDDAPAPEIKAAYGAIEVLKSEAEIATLLAKVSDKLITESLVAAKKQTDDFDAATKPVNQVIEEAEIALQCPGVPGPLRCDFTAARLRFAALRYDAEARLNQVSANLYELQVRKNNLSAERHHGRSQRFFYGMLGAQLAVIIATFAMAARQRNLLWTLAAAAGITALVFAAYVYLYV